MQVNRRIALLLSTNRELLKRATSPDEKLGTFRHDLSNFFFCRRLVDFAANAIDLRALVDEHGPWPDASVRMEQLREALGAVLNDLPAESRLLIKLRFEDDLSAQEIATLLNRASPFHVYRQLNALFAEIRQRLLMRGIASSVP